MLCFYRLVGVVVEGFDTRDLVDAMRDIMASMMSRTASMTPSWPSSINAPHGHGFLDILSGLLAQNQTAIMDPEEEAIAHAAGPPHPPVLDQKPTRSLPSPKKNEKRATSSVASHSDKRPDRGRGSAQCVVSFSPRAARHAEERLPHVTPGLSSEAAVKVRRLCD
ncbi:unnamed protein product [Lota lota]